MVANTTNKSRQRPTKRGAAAASTTFSADEMSAMRERARELKSSRSSAAKADGESDLLAKIAEMPPADRSLAERFHALVKATAPGLASTTYYGMPAYAKDGNTVFWFKAAAKFKTRYATVGFSDKANLDDGTVWATEYAVTQLSPAEETTLAALVRKAVS